MSTHTNAISAAQLEAVTGSMPLIRREQTWGKFAIFGNTASAAVATWCFLTGGYIAYYLPAGPGAIAITTGTLLGVCIALFAALPQATKYGIESVRATRPTLGVRGTNITLVLVFLILAGWNSVLTIFLGRALAQTMIVLGWIGEDARFPTMLITGVLSCVVTFWLLRKGSSTLKWAGPTIATAVLVLSVLIMVVLISRFGVAAIFNAEALDGGEGAFKTNYMIVIELGIAGAIAWWPYIGGLTRQSRTSAGAILPAVLGLGAMMSAVLVVGAFAALMAPESEGDPTGIMIEIGGTALGVVMLLFIVFANVGTTMAGTYAAALSLKQSRAIDKRVPWRWAVAISLVPVAVTLIFFADAFMDHYGTFLAFAGVTLGPICGIQIVDYFILRRQRLHVPSLYDDGPSSKYWYVAGFNPAGIIAVACGITAYLLVLDPVTFIPHEGAGFEVFSASIPATVVAGIVYLVLSLVFGRLREGQREDAARHEAPVPERTNV